MVLNCVDRIIDIDQAAEGEKKFASLLMLRDLFYLKLNFAEWLLVFLELFKLYK